MGLALTRCSIKCSGELNCIACQERGLTCEGPPQRKRPRRDDLSSGASDDPASKQNAQATTVRRKSSLLDDAGPPKIAKFDSDETDDSGYSSSKHNVDLPRKTPTAPRVSIRTDVTGLPRRSDGGFSSVSAAGSTSAESTLHQASPFAFNVLRNPYEAHGLSSSTAIGRNEWRTAGLQDSANRTAPSEASPQSTDTQANSLTHSSTPAERKGSATSDSWWFNSPGNEQTSRELITTAEELEERARSLRSLALERQTEELDGTTSRRTLNGAPVKTSPPTQLSMLPFGSQRHETDDLASLFRPDGTLRSGLTPQTNDYSGFWGLGIASQGSLHTTGQSQPMPTFSSAPEPMHDTQTAGAGQSVNQIPRSTIRERRMHSKLSLTPPD